MVVLFLIIAIISCSKSSNNNDEFTLEKTEVKLPEGTSVEVKLTSNHTDFSVTQTDEGKKIATVTFLSNKKVIDVKGIKIGKTEVRIVDNKTKLSKILRIEVLMPSIQSSDYEIEGMTLKKWKNTKISTIDMQSDPALSKITVIGEDAFSSAENITSVILPKGLETIGRAAFGKTSLESIVIPDGVKTISENAFRECLKLTSVVLPNGLNHLGKAAFANTKLKSVTIPSSIKVIPENAFEYCENLTLVTISEGITTLAANTFKNCISLKEITLPKTITDIHTGVFLNCTKLETVTIQAENPPNIVPLVFSREQQLKTTIYIPKGKKNAYIGRADWSPYAPMIKEK